MVRAGLHVQLDGGYYESDYSGLVDGETRRDRYFFVRPGLLYNFAQWGFAAVSYEFRRNRSTSSFENNQITFLMNFSY